jgi:hypothetical protein
MPYLRAGGVVLRDLLALADVSSEAFSDVGLGARTDTLAVVALFLHVVFGLLENVTRRRGQLLPPILAELGLSRGAQASPEESDNAYEVPWVSIVIAATAAASSLFTDTAGTEDSSPETEDAGARAGRPRGIAPWRGGAARADFVAEYATIALELFSSCLAVRDGQTHVANDTPVVGAVVGLAQAAVEPVAVLLRAQANAAVGSTPPAHTVLHEDTRLLRPAAKTLSALEQCFHRPGYAVAFRECEGVVPVSSLIDSFGANADLVPTMLRQSVKHVLLNATSLLCEAIDSTRRGTTLSNTETGVQVLTQQSFGRLCTAVFSSPYGDHGALWVNLLNLIRVAINTDPPFLAQFLQSSYVPSLSKALKKSLDDALLKSTNDHLVMPVVRLASALCITADGQAYVLNNRMIQFVVDAVLHPSMLLPRSRGLSADTHSRCGRWLMTIAKESEAARQPVRSAIVSNLVSICVECRKLGKILPAQDEATLNSPRIQVPPSFPIPRIPAH